MPLTREFKETVQARAHRDSDFRRALLGEAVETLMSGDLELGKTLLRDYVNATVGFEGLSESSEIPVKSLMRMLSNDGNPRSDNLFKVLRVLQEKEGVNFDAVLHQHAAMA
jgi:hypothetical protein